MSFPRVLSQENRSVPAPPLPLWGIFFTSHYPLLILVGEYQILGIWSCTCRNWKAAVLWETWDVGAENPGEPTFSWLGKKFPGQSNFPLITYLLKHGVQTWHLEKPAKAVVVVEKSNINTSLCRDSNQSPSQEPQERLVERGTYKLVFNLTAIPIDNKLSKR